MTDTDPRIQPATEGATNPTRKCCGNLPHVFTGALDHGHYTLCLTCYDGTGPCKTRKEAVRQWDAMGD